MQHKVNIDKECSFIEALRDDHYAPFGGVRNSRGRDLCMADDPFAVCKNIMGGNTCEQTLKGPHKRMWI